LRAGVHGAPHSARSVARILHISIGREQLLERMSLLALQTTGRGGCGGSSTAATVPISEPAQLTSAAPWVAPAGATPIATASSSPSSSSPSSPSAQQVRAAGGRSAAPVVITPAATRTVEQASTGQDAVSWPEIVLLVILVLAVSLVVLPSVRRRILPALAGLPPVDGHAGRAGVASVVAATALADAAAPAAETPVAPESAPAAEAPGSLEPAEPARLPEPPVASPSPAGDPQAQTERPAVNPGPAVQGQTRPTWVREHATQGALVATVLAGGLVRILKRGRGR
jgi:hypothetical protein